MTAIKDWSTTAGDNDASDLFPEGMNPSDVNDNMRGVLAALRAQYETGGWIQLHDDGTVSHTVTYNSATSFIASGDRSAIYTAGRRVKCVAATPGTIYGTISSNSVSTNTTVNVQWDSGSLSNETLTISVGSNVVEAATREVVAVPATKTSAYTVTAADHKRTIVCSGTLTVSLPGVGAVSDGFTVDVINVGTGTATIEDDSTDLINGQGTIILGAKMDSVRLVSTGATWYTVSDNRAHYARYYPSSQFALSASTWTVVKLNTEDADTAGYSVSSYKVYPPEDGVYEVSGSVTFDSADDATLVGASIYLDTTRVSLDYDRQSVSGTPPISKTSAIVSMTTANYVQLKAFLGEGSGSIGNLKASTYLEIKRLR